MPPPVGKGTLGILARQVGILANHVEREVAGFLITAVRLVAICTHPNHARGLAASGELAAEIKSHLRGRTRGRENDDGPPARSPNLAGGPFDATAAEPLIPAS